MTGSTLITAVQFDHQGGVLEVAVDVLRVSEQLLIELEHQTAKPN